MSWKWFTDWIQSLEFVTQSAHFFAGLGVVSLAAHFTDPILAGVLFWLVWAAPKEIIFDWLPFGEGHGSPDWDDLLFYTLGDFLAVCIIHFGAGK